MLGYKSPVLFQPQWKMGRLHFTGLGMGITTEASQGASFKSFLLQSVNCHILISQIVFVVFCFLCVAQLSPNESDEKRARMMKVTPFPLPYLQMKQTGFTLRSPVSVVLGLFGLGNGVDISKSSEEKMSATGSNIAPRSMGSLFSPMERAQHRGLSPRVRGAGRGGGGKTTCAVHLGVRSVVGRGGGGDGREGRLANGLKVCGCVSSQLFRLKTPTGRRWRLTELRGPATAWRLQTLNHLLVLKLQVSPIDLLYLCHLPLRVVGFWSCLWGEDGHWTDVKEEEEDPAETWVSTWQDLLRTDVSYFLLRQEAGMGTYVTRWIQTRLRDPSSASSSECSSLRRRGRSAPRALDLTLFWDRWTDGDMYRQTQRQELSYLRFVPGAD